MLTDSGMLKLRTLRAVTHSVGAGLLNAAEANAILNAVDPEKECRLAEQSMRLWEALDDAHTYTEKCDAYRALLASGDLDPVRFERLMAKAASEEMARTGQKERYS